MHVISEIYVQPGRIGGFEADQVRSWSSQDNLDVVDGRCFDENILEESLQQNGSCPSISLSSPFMIVLQCSLFNILEVKCNSDLHHLIVAGSPFSPSGQILNDDWGFFLPGTGVSSQISREVQTESNPKKYQTNE